MDISHLGRSRGGFSAKIHLAIAALDNALRFISTGGERNDITQTESLVADRATFQVIADKRYDAEPFIMKLKDRNSEVVIPSRINRKVPRKIDTHLY